MVASRNAVLRGTGQPFTLETVHLDDPGPGEALVRIVGAGMCRTDNLTRTGLFGAEFLPAILGHEGSGVVERVGPGVTTVSEGDRVVLTFDSCGRCDACRRAIPTSCVEFEVRNFSGRRPDGTTGAHDSTGAPLTGRWFGQSSFGQYALATERNLVPVGDAPLELLGPLGCGVQTGAGTVLNILGTRPGTSIAVFGTGAVGLSAVMAARLAGATEIVAVDLNQERLKLALELGATRAVDAADPGYAAAVRGAGPGLDASFDTTGVTTVMAIAIEVLRRPGHAALAGAGLDLLTIHPASLAGKTVSYVFEGGALPHLFIPQLIEYWRQGRFPFDRLIRTYPMADINEAEADAKAGRTVKPVLIPSPGDAA